MFAGLPLKTGLYSLTLCASLLLLLSACGDTQNKTTSSSQEQASDTPPTEAVIVETQAPADPPAQQGLTDPFAYCESVTTIDSPDERYTGEAVPESLIQTSIKQNIIPADSPSLRKSGFMQWRCMDQHVYICLAGANLPCEVKADTSTTAHAGIRDYCQKIINSDDTLPAVVTVPSVYAWTCVDSQPKRGEQVLQTDSQGFAKTYWTMLPKR